MSPVPFSSLIFYYFIDVGKMATDNCVQCKRTLRVCTSLMSSSSHSTSGSCLLSRSPDSSPSPPRSGVQEEHQVGPQLQEPLLQPVDPEPAGPEPVHCLGPDPHLRLAHHGLPRHHGHRERQLQRLAVTGHRWAEPGHHAHNRTR